MLQVACTCVASPASSIHQVPIHGPAQADRPRPPRRGDTRGLTRSVHIPRQVSHVGWGDFARRPGGRRAGAILPCARARFPTFPQLLDPLRPVLALLRTSLLNRRPPHLVGGPTSRAASAAAATISRTAFLLFLPSPSPSSGPPSPSLVAVRDASPCAAHLGAAPPVMPHSVFNCGHAGQREQLSVAAVVFVECAVGVRRVGDEAQRRIRV